MVSRKKLFAILIILVVSVGILIPVTVWLTRPCQIDRPSWPDWVNIVTWMNSNLTANTPIVTWGITADQINRYTNFTSPIYCGMSNNTIKGLVGRLFMATTEAETIEIMTALNASYIMVHWTYFYPTGLGDEQNWQAMIEAAAKYLDGTKWEIDIIERWNATGSKPTCAFFNTTLWKMLTYGEPFIDYDEDAGNAALIEYFLQYGYPLGYFLAHLNWADPWVPGTQPYQGTWEDDSGHLWKDHNPALGDGMIDDGYVEYGDGDSFDDTVGQFANLEQFTCVNISSGHLYKIFKIA